MPPNGPGQGVERWRVGLVGVLGVLTCGAAFYNGGFFAGTTGLLAVLVGALAVVWLVAAPDPLAGFTRAGITGVVALALLATLQLLSSQWSHSAARATLEFDRTLIYALVFGLFAAVPGGNRTLRLLVLAVGPALAIAAIAGWLSRAAPQLVDVAAARDRPRLSWPTGYWNALGLACCVGALITVAGVVDARRHPVVRGLLAGLLPSLLVCGYLTLSRGMIVAAVVGAVPLLLVRGRIALLPALAGLAAAAVAVVVAYDEPALTNGPLEPGPLERAGHGLVIAVIVCSVVGAVAAGVLARLTQDRPRGAPWRRQWRAAVGALIVLAIAGVGFGSRDAISRTWDDATRSGLLKAPEDARTRLSEVAANGRIENWRAALDMFDAEPLRGTGAGTYDLTWNRVRKIDLVLHDGHSLYLETLGELGIVGIVLLLAGLAPGALALLRRARNPALAALAGATLAWAVHAGIDWDWEMPAITMWVFAVLGAACADDGATTRMSRGSPVRLVGALGVAFLLITPFNIARSQPALSDALRAFQRGDCRTAISRSLDAAQDANQRPEPFQLISYCDVRIGQNALAQRAAGGALRRDPEDWNIRYGAALVDGATGRDPRPQMRAALAANPLNKSVQEAVKRLDRARTPAAWERVSRKLPLLFEGYYKP